MLKVSLQNELLFKPGIDNETYYRMYRDAGIDGVDYTLFNVNEKDGFPDKIFRKSTEEIIETVIGPDKEKLERYGLSVFQTHSPFPTYLLGEDDKNEARRIATEKSIELTAYLGAKYVVVHPFHQIFLTTPAEQRKRNIDFYTQFIDVAKKNHVTICLENMWVSRNTNIFESACEDPHEANDYIDTLNALAGEEIFGFCFDTGHATLCGRYMKNTLEALGSRVKVLHIHDASKTSDLHTIPYALSSGSHALTDWTGFIDGLRGIEYRGDINFEAGNAFLIFPESTHPALCGLFAAIGRHFADEVRKEKEN